MGHFYLIWGPFFRATRSEDEMKKRRTSSRIRAVGVRRQPFAIPQQPGQTVLLCRAYANDELLLKGPHDIHLKSTATRSGFLSHSRALILALVLIPLLPGVGQSVPVVPQLVTSGDGTYPVINSQCDPISQASQISVVSGGGVLSAPEVVDVYWPGTQSVDPQVRALFGDFVTDLFDGPHWDAVMPQYVGAASGTYEGSYHIAPLITIAPSNQLSTSDFGPELAAQIASGALPLFGENLIYYVHIPPGITITDPNPSGIGTSCVDWCALHDYFIDVSGAPVSFTYIVHPDYTQNSGCGACGIGTPFQAYTSAAAHELFETVTDPYGAGWINQCVASGGEEIADLCASYNFDMPRSTFGADSPQCPQQWRTQAVYSNATGGCEVVDWTSELLDCDGDSVNDAVDNCPSDANPLQEDADLDGLGNACDVCPVDSDPGQEDEDLDGVGDACPSTPPALTAAQADFEQAGFLAVDAIDGGLAQLVGWSINAGGTSRTFTVETQSDFDSISGIRIRLSHRYGFDYRLGRFRLSYTTDARGTFGPASGNWTVLDSNIGSFADALETNNASAQPDGSWLVLPGGTSPADYVLDYPVLTSGITGFRLEALVDPSLPATGPGWASNGNFILNELEITDEAAASYPPVAIPLTNPVADYEQSGRPVSVTVDGSLDSNQGWSIDSGGIGRTMTLETQTDLESTEAISVKLYNRYAAFDFRLGRFRLAYTTDARGTFGPASGNWTVLDSNLGTFADSLSKSSANAQGDGSWLVEPGDSSLSDYELDYPLIASGITGFRLEAMLDPSLPANGPGWAANGNFQLTEIEVRNVPEPGTVAMLSVGCVVLAGLVDRRRKRAARTLL